MSANLKMLERALEYYNLGYNVIPVGKDKRPLIKWEIFQTEKSTKKQIEGWFEHTNANIGIVTGEISNLFVIDTDTEEATKEVQNYLPENILTPIQTTPHNGRHFFFKHIEGFSNRARIAPGIDIRTKGGFIVVDPSVNGNGRRWKWLEGLALGEVVPICLPDALYSYIKEFAFNYYKETTKRPKTPTTIDHNFFEFGRRDEDLFSVANAMAGKGKDSNFISNVLERLILSWGENPDKRWIDAKIKSAFDRIEKRDRNISEEVKQFMLTTKGHVLTTDVHNGLQLTTRNEKKAVVMSLLRLVDEGLIERAGERNGCYRLIESHSDEIDFINVEEKVIGLRWPHPFNIERWVKILPKNIIVIAGESNAGKTAFLLNTVMLNMDDFKIHYYSSEMGAMELRDRLKKFEVNLQHWKDKVNFRERSSNFADVIKPNDVNVIDFLDITDEFYKIGGMIKEIYEKLKKGVAVIALQKNKGVELGLGGARSLEKARLYLSIGEGNLKIVKGKNWATEHNPNGMQWKFKIIQGAKFLQVED